MQAGVREFSTVPDRDAFRCLMLQHTRQSGGTHQAAAGHLASLAGTAVFAITSMMPAAMMLAATLARIGSV